MSIKSKLTTTMAAWVAIIISAVVLTHGILYRGFLQEGGVLGLVARAAFLASSSFAILQIVFELWFAVMAWREKRKRELPA